MSVRASFWDLSSRGIARYIPIFLVFLVIGIAGGRAAGMVFQDRLHGENGALFARQLGNSQRNLVVLIVDQARTPEAQLDGIWLLITTPESPRLILVPVYPGQTAWAESLKGTFTLTEDIKPGTEFLELLTDLVLWDHYLLIDRDGINSIFPATRFDNSVGADHDLPNGHITGNPLTLEKQISYWNSICADLSSINDKDEFEAFYNHFSPDVWTNLSRNELNFNPWGATGAEQNITCEFPTLNLVPH